MTEGSPVSDKLQSGIYRHTLPYKSEENVVDTSNRMVRFMLTLLGNGVDRIFLYTMGNYRHFEQASQRWATNVMEDGYPHPSAAAHANFAWLIEDTRLTKTLELAPGVYAYLFAGDRRSVAVLSTAPGFSSYTIPQNAAVRVLDLFGNPLTGRQTMGENLVYLTTQGSVEALEKLLGGRPVPTAQ
jgi:hypothetical protein